MSPHVRAPALLLLLVAVLAVVPPALCGAPSGVHALLLSAASARQRLGRACAPSRCFPMVLTRALRCTCWATLTRAIRLRERNRRNALTFCRGRARAQLGGAIRATFRGECVRLGVLRRNEPNTALRQRQLVQTLQSMERTCRRDCLRG